MENGKKVVFGKISVDSVAPGLNTIKDQAQLRQIVETIYPEVRGNDLFSSDDFGGEGSKYESTRVMWIDVPAGTALEEVQARLDKFPNARIQRTLGLKVHLTDAQIQARIAGINTKTDAEYAASQMVKDEQGQPVLYHGKPMYRVYSLSLNGDADIDLREQQLESVLAKETPFVPAEEVTGNIPV